MGSGWYRPEYVYYSKLYPLAPRSGAGLQDMRVKELQSCGQVRLGVRFTSVTHVKFLKTLIYVFLYI